MIPALSQNVAQLSHTCARAHQTHTHTLTRGERESFVEVMSSIMISAYVGLQNDAPMWGVVKLVSQLCPAGGD
jgi:hypothetical protein